MEDELEQDAFYESSENFSKETDDFMIRAQDSYFEGNLSDSITFCERALELDPNDKDALELVCLSLFQMVPADYQKALDYALKWGERCGETPRQLMFLIRAAYHCNPPEREKMIQASRKLSESRQDIPLYHSLAAALLADLGDYAVAREIVQKCDLVESAMKGRLNEEESDDWLRVQTLLSWISLMDRDSGRKTDEFKNLEEIVSTAPPNSFSASLSYALFIIQVMEVEGDLQKAKEMSVDLPANITLDDNISAVRVLISKVFSKENTTTTLVSNLESSWSTSLNDLIRRRLERKVLFVGGELSPNR